MNMVSFREKERMNDMFDMDQPLSIEKVRDYANLKKDTQFAMCIGLVETRPTETILNMNSDFFKYIRKYTKRNIKNTDLRSRILGANNALFGMANPFNDPSTIAQGLAGMMILKELLDYEKERGNEK